MAPRSQDEYRRTRPEQYSGLKYTVSSPQHPGTRPPRSHRSEILRPPGPRALSSRSASLPQGPCPLCAQVPVRGSAEKENGKEKSHKPLCTLAPPLLSCPPHPLGLHPHLSPPLGLGDSRIGVGAQEGQVRFKKTLSCSNYLGHLPETQLLSFLPSLVTFTAFGCHINF